jgi:hypothetical protein
MFPSPRQARTMAPALGWFSIGLGLAQLLAPRAMARAVGMAPHDAMMQACGLRELACGVGLLRGPPEPWLWARAGGDALDLAALALGGRGRGGMAALAAVAAVAVVDLACARALSRRPAAPAVDYSDRSGWPLPPEQMRGAALTDFEPPRDMGTPPALRPWAAAPRIDGTPGAAQGLQPGAAGARR